MKLVPLSLKDANAFITTHHRHNKKVQGHKFSLGLVEDNCLVGCVVAGRPVARKLDDGLTIEITRLCVNDQSPVNACSYLYRAAWRVASSMGYARLITYTLASESGASLKGAGFLKTQTSPAWEPGKGWTTRQGRAWQPVHSEKKIRWEIMERRE